LTPIDEVEVMSITSSDLGKQRRYADTRKTAEYLGCSETFLEKNRLTGAIKIPFIKLGKKVLYDLDVVDAVMAENTRLSTSDSGKAA
jgi:hypothetical protein